MVRFSSATTNYVLVITNTYMLLHCRSVEGEKDENFNVDEVDPEKEPSACDDACGGNKKVITLRDCLQKFAENEQLPETETVFCGTCKEVCMYSLTVSYTALHCTVHVLLLPIPTPTQLPPITYPICLLLLIA